MTLSADRIKELIGVKEDYKAPDTLMSILLDRSKREQLFKRFLSDEPDLSYDWFRAYFQAQQADRSSSKQDFTPQSISRIVSKIVGLSANTLDVAAGVGGLTIEKWNQDRQQKHYDPDKHHYVLEELTESAMPFLLFNCMIRGMNAVLINGDTLERKVRQIYLLQRDGEFSSLNILPHSEEVADQYNVHEWTATAIDHHEFQEWHEPEQMEML